MLFRDPETKKLLYINEPYKQSHELSSGREAWDEAHLFDVRPMDWGNLYISRSPIFPELVSLKGQGADLDKIEERLRAYGPALGTDAINLTLTAGELERAPRFWQDDVTSSPG